MVTIDDIAGAVKARLAAVSGQATTCPGGHWFDRAPDAPDGYPYDVFRVRSAQSTPTTGGGYVQIFTVELAGYCPIGDTGVNTQSVQQLFNDALVSSAAVTALQAVSLRNATEKILAGRLADEEGRYDRSQRQGRDVFVAGMTAELIVQGDRSVT